MLSAHPSSIHFNLDDDDEWMPATTTHASRLFRTSSISSWGVTSFGRGYDWHSEGSTPKASEKEAARTEEAEAELQDELPARTQPQTLQKTPIMASSPTPSLAIPADSVQPKSSRGSAPSSPRPRRRSSQQRVSLIAGRVSIAPIDPAESLLPTQGLRRTASSGSTLSTAVSTRAPSPCSDQQSFLGERNISEFVIEGEIGRGAYGLVKRAREKRDDGAAGVSRSSSSVSCVNPGQPPLIIKQVIKSRILADCWKKHPKHGTIPIEIYVMNAISNTPFVLPGRRPWDPSRLAEPGDAQDGEWVEGKVVKGHPNICPLLDFFEDSHYYYLVLPSTTPEHLPNEPSPPSDLFDLVEAYPHGLPPDMIRTYLGQIADALCFLHSHGIGELLSRLCSLRSRLLSPPRHQGRECSAGTKWEMYINRLWELWPCEEVWLGHL